MRGRLGAAALAALGLLLLGGCLDSRGDPPPSVRVLGLRWDQFPDIPFPPGWKPIPGEERVAMAIAGGSVRRLRLALQAPPARTDLQPDQAIRREVAAILPEYGWVRDGGRDDAPVQRWRKGDEVLTVRAEREDGLAVLRYSL